MSTIADDSSVEEATSKLADVTINTSSGVTGSISTPGPSSIPAEPPLGSESGHTSGGSLANRKRDMPHNFIKFAERRGLVNPKICDGSLTKVWTNHFRLKLPSSLKVYQYNIEFEVLKRGVKEQLVKRERTLPIFWACVQDNPKIFPPLDNIIYNDVNMLWSSVPLTLNKGDESFEVPIRRFDPVTRRFPPPNPDRPPSICTVHIVATPAVIIDLPKADENDAIFLTMFFDLVLSQIHRCPLNPNFGRFMTFGKSLFEIPDKNAGIYHDIGGGKQVWTGLHGAIKCGTKSGTILNVDLSSAVFYKMNIPVIQFFCEVVNGYRVDELRHMNPRNLAIDKWKCMDLEKELKGVMVRIEIPGTNVVRRKKVKGVSAKPANADWFSADGVKTTIADYFREKYNYILEYPNFPCLEFKGSPAPAPGGQRGRGQDQATSVRYPLELCFCPSEPWKYKGRMSEALLAAMIRISCRVPQKQMNILSELAVDRSDILSSSAGPMQTYGVDIDRNFMEVTAKFLPMPKIHTKRFPVMDADKATGGHMLFTHNREPIKALEVPNKILLPRWFLINRALQQDQAYGLAAFFHSTLRGYGFSVAADKLAELESVDLFRNKEVNVGEIEHALVSIRDRAAALSAEHGVDYLPVTFFVFPYKHSAVYSTIKYYGDIKYGMITQCMDRKQIRNFTGNSVTNSTATNIFLKLLSKCGGIHHKLDRSVHKNWAKVTNPDDPTLFLAIDVSHPGAEERAQQKGNRNNQRGAKEGEGYSFVDCPRSVYAIMGNVDFDAIRYQYSSRVQRMGEERGDYITDQVVERLTDFYKHTGKSPAHIVVYRDGVSESEFRKTLYEERESIYAACMKVGLKPNRGEANPTEPTVSFTYIVAQKRHHTKFYAMKKEDISGKAGNVRPGLLVEEDIVFNDKFDFYITSHFGALGTSRPTHYTILEDTWPNASASFWQTIIYAHTFGYSRCPRSISIPAPLMYAHLAAKRAKMHFDYFKINDHDYCEEKETIVRVDMEQKAVRAHSNIRELRGANYC